MARTESRGHLYATSPKPPVRVSVMIALFTIAYALLLLAIGFIPLNMFLGKLLGSAAMPVIWRNSVIQLAARTLVAAAGCWAALTVTGRGRGRLTGPGMLGLGAAMSGALASAVDVGLHHLLVRQMNMALRISAVLSNALSLGITAAVVIIVTLLLIPRQTRPATAA